MDDFLQNLDAPDRATGVETRIFYAELVVQHLDVLPHSYGVYCFHSRGYDQLRELDEEFTARCQMP